MRHRHFRFRLGVGHLCLGSSPALEGGVGVKVFGWRTACSQKRSDPILLFSCSKPSLIPHYMKTQLKCLNPRPVGLIPDLPLTTPTCILCPSNSKLQKIVNLLGLSLPTQCPLPGMLSLPICFTHIARLDLRINPFKKPLLDFLPRREGSFFVVSSPAIPLRLLS